MGNTKIKLFTLGNIPTDLLINKINNYKSECFTIIDTIENIPLRGDCDIHDWSYSDNFIRDAIPSTINANQNILHIIISNIGLEYNWFARRLSDNCVVMTLFDIKEAIRQNNIPLHNIVLRIMYAYSIRWQANGDKLPQIDSPLKFSHDETRGCIFDMNGIKSEVVESLDMPIICDECEENIKKSHNITYDKIDVIKKELKKIKRDRYYAIVYFVKNKPYLSLFIASIYAFIIGLITSLIYDLLKTFILK